MAAIASGGCHNNLCHSKLCLTTLALIFSLPCQQMSQQPNHYAFDLSTSFNHDHKPATLQPVDLTVEVAYD